MKAQCIVCKCGSVIAACRLPECYQEASWMADVRKYVAKGYEIDVKECGQFTLAYCVCETIDKSQLKIFA